MSSSNSPCAACKLLRRKCTQECVFAPHFPQDQPQKFANVHKVFGASNVAKLLNDLNASQREDAVISLVYEAEARLRDPIYGCVGLISILQHRLKQVHQDLYTAKNELSNYINEPSSMLPMIQHQQPGFIQPHPNITTPPAVFPHHMQAQMLGLPAGQPPGAAQFLIRDQHRQQILEAQQLAAVAPMLGFPAGQSPGAAQFVLRDQQLQQILEAQQLAAVAAAREQQEMFRTYEQQPQQSDQLVRLNAGFDTAGQVTASGFNQMNLGGLAISPSLALDSYDNPYQIQQQPQDHSHYHHQIQSQDDSYHQNQILSQLLLEQQHHRHQMLSQFFLEQQHLALPQQQDQPLAQPQVAPQQQQDQPLAQLQVAPQQQQDQPLAQPQVAPQRQQDQPLAQPQVARQQQHIAGSEEGRSVGPSC